MVGVVVGCWCFFLGFDDVIGVAVVGALYIPLLVGSTWPGIFARSHYYPEFDIFRGNVSISVGCFRRSERGFCALCCYFWVSWWCCIVVYGSIMSI